MLFPTLLILSQLLSSSCRAGLVNVRIDDTRGNQRSGHVPQYTSVHAWNAGSPTNQCPACGARPDVTKAFDGTWHDDTTFPGQLPSNVTFAFNGSVIYIFFILANNIDVAHKDTRLAFYLDGSSKAIHQFLHQPDLTVDGLLYNQLVFKTDLLPTGEHNMLISSWADGDSGSIALFDYAIYSTTDDDSLSPTITTSIHPTPPASTSSSVRNSSTVSTGSQAPAPSSPLTSPISTSNSSSIGTPSSSDPSSPTVGDPSSAPTSPINAGAVVGGSVAGAAVAIILLPLRLLFQSRCLLLC